MAGSNVVTINHSAFAAALSPEMQKMLAERAAQTKQELGGGITAGFPLLTYRGKVWRAKARGEETMLMRQDNPREPRSSVEVVIVRASPDISKIFYEKGYEDGSSAPPDCFSVNGRVPDPASPKRQSESCAACPNNAWGSRVTDAGKKGKRCADSKRLAIVPAEDIDNEAMGGPMLLRVPPASLGDTKGYADQLAAMGFPAYAVVTRISFDHNEAYPKFVYEAVRPLNTDEFAKVERLRDDSRMERILSTAIEHVETDGTDTSHLQTPSIPPVPRTADGAPIMGVNPTTGEIQSVSPAPVHPSPVQASEARIAEVAAKVANPNDPFAAQRQGMRDMGLPEEAIIRAFGPEPEAPKPEPTPEPVKAAVVDPMATQRKAMRDMGLTEEMINAAIGPEPVAEEEPEPVDPHAEKRAQMKALGLTDEMINAALGVTPAGNSEPEKPKPVRKPRTTKPKEEPAALTPAPVAEAGPNPTVSTLPAEQPKANGQAPVPEDMPAPADFENFLGDLLDKHAS